MALVPVLHEFPPRPAPLALIDDHPLVRAGVGALLESQPDFLLVGEAGDATTARTLIAETKPHLALLDLKLSRDDGLVLLRELRWLQPTLRVVEGGKKSQALGFGV